MENKKILNNIVWRFLERSGAQGVNLLVSIILARLLLPEDYGIIGILQVLITLMDVFVDSGLASALIQKKNADEMDFSTVFYTNIVLCSVIYLLVFWLAPYFAMFYEQPKLTVLLRVMALQLIISGIKNVQQAYVARHMLFKKFFYSTLGGTIAAAGIGITMAYYGFGVWALVAQQLVNQFLDTCILWLTVHWRPAWLFSFQRLKELLSYGWKILAAMLTDKLYSNLSTLIIGKRYSSESLAFYNRGIQIPSFAANNISTAIDSVLLPTLSAEQDRSERIYEMSRLGVKVSIYVMAPMMMGLIAIAPSLVHLLLTDKWLPSVFYMRIFCIEMMFYPINAIYLNSIKALGRSDIFLKLELCKKGLGILILFFAATISVKAVAIGVLITGIISFFINIWPNKKLLGYHYVPIIRDIIPSLLLSGSMCVCVLLLPKLGWNTAITLLAQVVGGITFYIIGSFLLHMEEFIYVKRILLNMLSKVKSKY